MPPAINMTGARFGCMFCSFLGTLLGGSAFGLVLGFYADGAPLAAFGAVFGIAAAFLPALVAHSVVYPLTVAAQTPPLSPIPAAIGGAFSGVLATSAPLGLGVYPTGFQAFEQFLAVLLGGVGAYYACVLCAKTICRNEYDESVITGLKEWPRALSMKQMFRVTFVVAVLLALWSPVIRTYLV